MTAQLPYPDERWGIEEDGPRVLIECSDPAVAWAAEEILAREGYSVTQCWGPEEHGKCPLLVGGTCDLVEGADCIVQAFHGSQPWRTSLLEALKDALPAKRISVEVPRYNHAKLGDALAGCRVVDTPVTPARLRQAVEAMTKGRRKAAS